MIGTVIVQADQKDKNKLIVRPLTFLSDCFELYIALTKAVGGVYDPVRKCQVVPLVGATKLVDLFDQSGFFIDLDPSLGIKSPNKKIKLNTPEQQSELDSDIVNKGVALQAEYIAKGHRLWPYQAYGIAWLNQRSSGLLADQMGARQNHPGFACIERRWGSVGNLSCVS